MQIICCLRPCSRDEYVYMLTRVGPVLDAAGISFHICRPGAEGCRDGERGEVKQ